MTKLSSTAAMKELMATYYLEAKNASHNGLKVAWITSGAPVEYLHAAGVVPIYPENYAAMCAAAHASLELLQKAEEMGFCAELCSYARSDFGAEALKGGPLLGLPRPDFLLCATNICNTVTKWYEVLSRHFSVPLFVVDMPFVHEEITRELVDYVAGQFEALEGFLKQATGASFERSKLEQAVALSAEATRLWRQILELAKRKPAPLNSFDSFIHMAPIVTLRGTERAVSYYRLLLDELNERAERGEGSIPNERIRLLWDNLPVWYKMRFLAEFLASRDAAPVVATYTNNWALIGDVGLESGGEPTRALARAYLSPFINRGVKYRIDYMCRMIDEFSLDGFLMHSDRTCKPYSLTELAVKEQVQKRTGKPGLIIEADKADERAFSESQTVVRLEAFIESILCRH